MVRLGGKVGYALLDRITKWVGTEPNNYHANDPFSGSHIDRKFGPELIDKVAGKVVVDFGCGRGADAVRLALGGARMVYGLDINEEYLADARALAAKWAVTDRCVFLTPDALGDLAGAADYVISVDAFEHFQDPGGILAAMNAVLKPGGAILANWGPPWLHPYGAHMGHFCRLPWVHLLFAERTVLAVRSKYEFDRAERYEDTTACVNRMTVRRFLRVIAGTSFTCSEIRLNAVWRLKPLARNALTREFFTSEVFCELTKSSSAAAGTRPLPAIRVA